MFQVGQVLAGFCNFFVDRKITFLYLFLALALIGILFVIFSRSEFFRGGGGTSGIENLKLELINLKRKQENADKKLQSLNTRIKYGQIKPGSRSQAVLPFSREAMESTPFFSVIGTGIYDNLSGGDLSPTACREDEGVAEITELSSASVKEKLLPEDKTSHNIDAEMSDSWVTAEQVVKKPQTVKSPAVNPTVTNLNSPVALNPEKLLKDVRLDIVEKMVLPDSNSHLLPSLSQASGVPLKEPVSRDQHQEAPTGLIDEVAEEDNNNEEILENGDEIYENDDEILEDDEIAEDCSLETHNLKLKPPKSLLKCQLR